MSFDPENVESWGSGQVVPASWNAQSADIFRALELVRKSDYDQLLALYRKAVKALED